MGLSSQKKKKKKKKKLQDAREADGQKGKADSAALRPLDVLKGLRSSPQSLKQAQSASILTVLQRNRGRHRGRFLAMACSVYKNRATLKNPKTFFPFHTVTLMVALALKYFHFTPSKP
jgi:hypothetical protein